MSDKPKALYFFQYLPPWKIDVFNGMAERFDLTVVFFNADSEGFTYDRKDLLSRLRNVKTLFLDTGFNLMGRPVRFGIRSLIRHESPDIVFVHEYSPVSIALALLKRRYGFRLVVTTSDNPAIARSAGGLRGKARDFVIGRCDGAVLYGKEVEDFYRSRYPGLRTGVCPNIQDPRSLLAFRDRFPSLEPALRKGYGLENRKIVLYAGRLVEVKGLDLLLEAFAATAPEDWSLVLVGEGGLKETLERQATGLGIGDKVTFAGFHGGAEFYVWYDMASFLILPSRYEPFGAVVNEALVFGLPVVVSRYAGAVDFVEPSNGMVFDPLDAGAFREALVRAFERYGTESTERKNLMVKSFEESIEAYESVLR